MIGTGNKEMHPLLLSLANIHAGVCMKSTSNSFALAAYLPIPKFHAVSPAVQAVLSACVYHFAVSIVMKNLMVTNKEGKIMSDPEGKLRMVHTPLVSWITDHPEQLLISCTSSKSSPISLAIAEDFGQPTPLSHCTRYHTLQAIEEAVAACDPCDIAAFHKLCLTLRLNGVVEPFWKKWGNACPSSFLTPDALHQWHKFYFDHCLQWVINIIGGRELDRRLTALQLRIGTRHWSNGVSTLKQYTGQEHCDLEKLLPAMAAGALPNDVLCALCAITEFIFLAQSLFHYSETIHALKEALCEFHHFKASILSAGGRLGKNGPLDHFQVPKLELALHVERSIWEMGAPYQWSSDITEWCHITHVKTPYRLSNCRDFHSQCCRFLDCQEKQCFFQFFITLKSSSASLANSVSMTWEADLMAAHHPEATWFSSISPTEHPFSHVHPLWSIFDNPCSHVLPSNSTALLLTLRPHHSKYSIEQAATLFNLDDFPPALGDHFSGRSYNNRNGRYISLPCCDLPFATVDIWEKFRLQQCSVHDLQVVMPAQTVQAAPPSPTLCYA